MIFPITEILKKEEGFKDMPYFDPLGILTVGIGRNLISNPWTLEESKEWAKATFAQREQIAIKDLSNAINTIESNLDSIVPFFGKLDYPRKCFLIFMAYQLGIQGTLKFKNTLKLIEQKDYNNAMLALLDSKWAKQTPRRALRMAHLLQTGDIENYFN